MSLTIYYLDVDIEGCDAGIYLNGAPILAAWHREPTRCAPTVSEWIDTGRNVLLVVVSGLSAAEAATPHRVHVSLCVGPAGSAADPSTQALCTVSWAFDSNESTAVPARLQAEVDVQPAWSSWRWSSSPPLRDDAPTRAAVLGAVRLIHGSLSQGSVRVLLSASRVKFEEVGACYGLDLSAGRARFRAAWATLRQQASFQLAPLLDDDVVLRRFCDDRIVCPLTSQGRHVIRENNQDGTGWAMPLFLAEIDGVLEVVR